MASGPEAKYLEYAGYLPSAVSPLKISAGFRLVSHVIPPLSCCLLGALFIGGLVFYGHAQWADDRIEAQRRQALRTSIETFQLVQGNGDVEARTLRLLEEFSGVKQLRWETEPEQSDRELQSVVDDNGRIIGWLSWDQERPMTAAVRRFMPLFMLVCAGLAGLAVFSLWLTRFIRRELQHEEARTRKLSREDGLTGLHNTGSFFETLDQELAARGADQLVTFIFVDLMRFRDLDDGTTRPWLNELLLSVAGRITQMMPPGATAGRLGRHKFGVILRSENAAAGFRFAEDLAGALCRPYRIQGRGVQITAAAGLAHAPHDGLTGDELIRHATLAMRVARRTGRWAVSFEASMEANLQERRFVERELRRALEEGTLSVHYQPVVAADGSRIVGVEALLRWAHPTRGNIPPKTFVAIAEQTGLMEQLGEFAMRQALTDAKRWPELFISMNLSPLQVRNRGLFNFLSSVLTETGIDPARVILEVTEGVLIEDPEEMRKRLDELHGLGVRLALDDFGSGYSSLSYLQHFPFDKLKIDGSFVAPLGRSPNSAVIIQAIVALGRALDMSVLVEGVETEEQRVLLRLAGCDEMQGYLFARPAPRETIDKLLRDAKSEMARNARGKSAQAS